MRKEDKRAYSTTRAEADKAKDADSKVELKKKIRSASKRGKRDDGPKMSSKVLETWINETL